FLRPEFLGRVDEIITFRPLDQGDLERIAALMVEEYRPGLAARGLTLEIAPGALSAIVRQTPTRLGARELRKTIRKVLEDPLAEALISGRLADGQTVTLAADGDGKPELRLPE
ncbi:ATP-dependent Clp protease ATP-binding subunit, partial [bacterium]|nr:ATP-dependent Clp protease ATP-binding subunit [bacterium]